MAHTFVISVSPLIDVLSRALSITFEQSPVLCALLLVVLRSSCHQRMALHKHLSLINIASVTLTVALVKTFLLSSNMGTCEDMLFIYLCSIYIYIYINYTQVLILFQIP